MLAPKLIEEAKKLIKPDKTAIIDAPPGTYCQAVAAIKSTDFCILVTEPTPFGLHDLEIAYEVTKALKVLSGVIINKAENDQIIEDFCRKNNIPVLMKIPFQRKIAELYSKGIPLIIGKPEFKEKFQKLINFIKGIER